MLIPKNIQFALLILIGLFFSNSIIKAQSSRLYTMQDGLASTNINSVTQDKQGFIWITSVDGITRFDGKNFVTFNRNHDSGFTLRNNNVLSFFEDSQNNCWIGTKDGLHNFNRNENKFSYINLYSGEEKNELLSVTNIMDDPNNHNYLLIGTSGYGAFRLNKSDYTKDENWASKITALAGGYIDHMITDKTGNLWICNNKAGIISVDLKNNEQRKITLEGLISNDLLNLNNFEVLVLNNNNLLFGGLNGLYFYESEKNIIRRFNNKRLNSLICTSLYQQSDSIVLVGTENMGLWRVNLYDETADIINPSICPIDLKYSKIRSIMSDDQNNLWLGIFQKGLLTIPLESNEFEYLAVAEEGSEKNLSCNTSFEEDLNGNLWIGTDGAGIFVYKKDTKELLMKINSSNSILKSDAIMSIKIDNSGNMWIATYGAGIYCYENNRIIEKEELKILNKRVMVIEYDKKRNCLYAGTNGSGVWVYNLNTKSIYMINNIDNSWIKSLFLDYNQNLWISTSVSTCCMDVDSQNLINYNISDIRHKMTNSYAEDDNHIWFGTSEGLFVYNKSENQMIERKKDESNISLNVQSLCFYNNSLWMATSGSISKLDIKADKIYTYNTYEVEKIGCFRPNSSNLINESSIFFGGDNGVLKVNCDNFNIRTCLKRPIYLTGLIIQNQRMDYNPLMKKENFSEVSLWCAKNINLPFDKNSFILEFSAQEYTNPMKVKYAYKLEGFDKEWHYMNASAPMANYSNVPPGKYKFTVRAFFNEIPEDDSFKSIMINISNPWYLTVIAKVVYGLIFLVFAYFIHLYILIKRRRDNNLREIRQKEQIKEAKLKLFTSISHEIKTPLTLIISPLKKLLIKENDEETKKMYDLMHRNSMRILLLINQLMDIRKIDNGQMKLQFKEINLIEILNNVMLHFNSVAEIKNIDFKLEKENFTSIYLWADPVHFDKIFFNLLSNAFKFTPTSGIIKIRVKRNSNIDFFFENKSIKEYVEVSIFNEGSSIPKENLESVFERFFQGNNNDESGSGIGLDLAKQLTLMHYGKIKARNIENRGVEFTVYIPLGKGYISPEKLVSEPKKELESEMSENKSGEIEILEDVKSRYDSSLNIFDRNDSIDSDKKNKYSILFVDDDDELCTYIKSELDEYNITICNSGNSAWRKLLSNKFDIVVTDLIMSDGDGYELCRKIKSNPDNDHIPVIVLTAETNESSEELAMNCQADRFLQKPINITLLRGAIAQAVRIRENIINKINRNDITYDLDHIKVDSIDQKLIKKVTAVIHDNIENPGFSVEELSREIGISRVHLNRRLKEIIGMSPSSLIKIVRLKQSAYLLVNNKISISEVAYKVGFSSNSYFTNNFKSYFAMTPKEFINNYSKNPENEVFQKIFER